MPLTEINLTLQLQNNLFLNRSFFDGFNRDLTTACKYYYLVVIFTVGYEMGDSRELGGRPAHVSFVIKLWVEPREEDRGPVWRYHIHHVQSGEEAYFHDFAAMAAFIERKSGIQPPFTNVQVRIQSTDDRRSG